MGKRILTGSVDLPFSPEAKLTIAVITVPILTAGWGIPIPEVLGFLCNSRILFWGMVYLQSSVTSTVTAGKWKATDNLNEQVPLKWKATDNI